RGVSQAELGEPAAAAASFDTAIALQPDYYRAYYHRGLARLELKRPVDAAADFDTALRLRPGFQPALLQRAVARAGLGRHQLAYDDLAAARAQKVVPAQAWFIE